MDAKTGSGLLLNEITGGDGVRVTGLQHRGAVALVSG